LCSFPIAFFLSLSRCGSRYNSYSMHSLSSHNILSCYVLSFFHSSLTPSRFTAHAIVLSHNSLSPIALFCCVLSFFHSSLSLSLPLSLSNAFLALSAFKHLIIFGDFNAYLYSQSFDAEQIRAFVDSTGLSLVPFAPTHHIKTSST